MTVSPLTSPNNFYIYIIMRVKLSKNIDECGFIASVLIIKTQLRGKLINSLKYASFNNKIRLQIFVASWIFLLYTYFYDYHRNNYDEVVVGRLTRKRFDLYNLQIQFKIFHSHKWFLTVEEKPEELSLCEVFSTSQMGSPTLRVSDGFLLAWIRK